MGAGWTSTLLSLLPIQIWPSCTVNCSCMLREANAARAWLCAAGSCQTHRLFSRASLLCTPAHQMCAALL